MERCVRQGESSGIPIDSNYESGSTSNASFSTDESYTCPPGVVPVVPVTIYEDRAEEGARTLLGHIRPNWSAGNVTFTIFTAGYTNTLIGCRLVGGDGDDVVLVRIYGRGTSVMIDRDQEMNSMLVMNSVGGAAPVFCRFDNGIAYGYQPGVMLDNITATRPKLQKLIANELARMHSTDVSSTCQPLGYRLNFDTRPSLFRNLRGWIDHIPESFVNQQSKLYELGFDRQQLMDELDCLERTLGSLDSPVVFCHNDLLPKNLIYDEAEERVYFIDFEFAGHNYQAFDIANHFCEYAGMENVDFSLYPCREYQTKWLRIYLESLASYRGLESTTVTEYDVERLYVQVQKFTLACHLFWAFWALIQSMNSSIDYDYLDFAHIRLSEYKNRKTGLLLLEIP